MNQESEKAEVEQEKREHDIALGNPLLNPMKDVGPKRRYDLHHFDLGSHSDVPTRWDDDVVFKNQARGTENKGKKEFVNVKCHRIPPML